MTFTWKPITLGPPKVHGPDSRWPGLLRVTAELSSQPGREWCDFFARPAGVSMPVSMHPPEINGSQVVMRPPDGEEAKYLDHARERVASANARFEAEVLPRIRADEERRAAEAADQERRIREAQERLNAEGPGETPRP
jgi:hypothetical protein